MIQVKEYGNTAAQWVFPIDGKARLAYADGTN
jgi:hypothetical protein